MSQIVGFDLTARFLYSEGAPELQGLENPLQRFETEFHSRLKSYFHVDRVSHQRLKPPTVQEYEAQYWLEADDVEHALEIFQSIMNGRAPEVIEVVASTILSLVVPNKPIVAVSVANVRSNINEMDLQRGRPVQPPTDQTATSEGVRHHLVWQLRQLTPLRALAVILIGVLILFLYNAGLRLVDVWANSLQDQRNEGPPQVIEVSCPIVPGAPAPSVTAGATTRAPDALEFNYQQRRDCPSCPVITYFGSSD